MGPVTGPRIELWLKFLHACPGRMIAEFHQSDGKVYFCDFMRANWFKEFNREEATDSTEFPDRVEPDLVYEDGILKVVK